MSLTLQQLPMTHKLLRVALDITDEKGEFGLFGLFLREGAPGTWDLVISAPWLDANKKAGIEHVAKKLKARLSAEELLSLSRIVVIETEHEGVRAIRTSVAVRGTIAHLENTVLFGLPMEEAYIIISQDPLKSREALQILADLWTVKFRGGRERARIDSEGNYYVEDPKHGYELSGDPKYVLQSIRYDARSKTITFTKLKPDGTEPKPETLTVISERQLEGHKTGAPSHKLSYTRSSPP